MDMHSPFKKVGVFAPLSSSPIETGTPARLQPQQLGYLSLVIDVVLYVGAGIAAWIWLDPQPSDMFKLMALTTLALTFVIFTACCRAFKTHDPLVLLHSGAPSSIAKVIVNAGLPALIPLLISLPLAKSGDASVHDFIGWLFTFELLAVSTVTAAHGVFHAARPRLARSLFTPRRIAVVGSGESAARLIRWVELTAPGLFEIIGVFDDRDSR